jgi:transposase
MEHKLGKSRHQIAMFCLNDRIKNDSPVRMIDKFVDMTNTDYFTNSEAKDTGRPPYNPKDMLKLLIYGMENGITSTRKLENACNVNIELMWLINELPDNTTIRNFRRNNAKNIIRFFNEFVVTLYKAGYIDGKLLSIDGTKIRANNSKKNNFSAKKIDWQINYLDNKIDEYLNEIDANDKLDELYERREKYIGYKEKIEEGEVTEISTTDPDSRLMRQNNNGVDVCYNVQTAVDSKHKLVAGVIAINSASDQGQLYKVAKSVKDNLNLEETTVLADKGYYSTDDFHNCIENNIEPIVAKPNVAKTETFSKAEFIYDKEEDCYYCPANQKLNFNSEDKNSIRYYSNCKACSTCPLKEACTKGDYRKIGRHKYEEDAKHNDSNFLANQELYKQRQTLSEHPFGTVKRTMGIIQFLSRGLNNVNAEMALVFLCYNLKRLRQIIKNNPNNASENTCIKELFTFFQLFFIIFALTIRK